MSFITCDWSGTRPFRPSISPLSLVTSLARSPAAAGATGPAGCAVPARAAPPASVATATKITMVLSDARIAVLPSARSSRAFYRATRDMSVPPPAANTTTSQAGAVAGYELLVGHPAGRDDLCLEQRKDDVASAKDQRPGAEKAIEDRKRLGPRELASDRQREQETEEQHEHGRAQAPPDGDRRSCGRRRDSARQESQPDQRRGGDDDDLRGSRRPDERADRRQERDRGTPAVGRERPRHAPDGERDHGH